MKKIILLLCLFYGLNLNAQLKVNGSVESGYYDNYTTIFVGKVANKYKNTGSAYSDIKIKLNYKGFNLEQSVLGTYMYEEGFSFTPLDMIFTTNINYKYKSWSIGWEHMCFHPLVNSYNEFYDFDAPFITYKRASHDKVYIKLEF